MKQTIRHSVFETNSSSEHSCILCSEEEYKKLQDGEWFLYEGKILTREDVMKEYKGDKDDEDEFAEWISDEGYYHLKNGDINNEYSSHDSEWNEIDVKGKKVFALSIYAESNLQIGNSLQPAAKKKPTTNV